MTTACPFSVGRSTAAEGKCILNTQITVVPIFVCRWVLMNDHNVSIFCGEKHSSRGRVHTNYANSRGANISVCRWVLMNDHSVSIFCGEKHSSRGKVHTNYANYRGANISVCRWVLINDHGMSISCGDRHSSKGRMRTGQGKLHRSVSMFWCA